VDDQLGPVKDELPASLPGFDLAAGLSRLMGNKRLYRKLLLDFGVKYDAVAGEIREALAAGNFKLAHGLVHNLKGLAGNLAAEDLHSAVVAMEKLVKGQDRGRGTDELLNRKITELERALTRALDAVKTLGPMVEKKSTESTAGAISSLPPELVRKVADRIKAALEMGDVMQIKSIAEDMRSKSDAVVPFCDRIIELAQDFDFDGIQQLVFEVDS
jgi:HPt (histidine-containing phosphotransfer) domain-containing protein